VSTPAQPMMPTPTDPVAASILAQFQQQLEAKNQQLEAKERALEFAEFKIQALEERLRQHLIARYGKRSETLSDLQLQLLDLEPGVSSEEIEAESEREPIPARTSAQIRRQHPGRQTLPAHLERVEQIVACTAEQCTCGQCGKETTVIGYEETEVLDVRPAEYFVTVIQREKRACKGCEELGVQTADVPEPIVPKSLLSDQVILGRSEIVRGDANLSATGDAAPRCGSGDRAIDPG
jgi:transposase